MVKFGFFRVTIFFLLVYAFLSPNLYSQEKKDQEITYDIEVSAITISVTVQDKKGRFINDLTREDFNIYENDEKKDISYFNHNFESPLSLTVLLDVSGSMALQDRLNECKAALHYLINYLLDDQDEISLLIFADGEVEVAVNFAKDRDDFFTTLDNTEAYGQTALNDAVAVSPEYATKGKNEKRALLLITDGIENDSQYSYEQAIEVAKRVDIPIFTIAYKIPLSEKYLKKYKHSPTLTSTRIVYSLEKFSDATGGKAFFLDSSSQLVLALRQIKKELGHQYIISYTSYANPDNDYRKIKVVTSNKKHRVRTRKGYYSSDGKDK